MATESDIVDTTQKGVLRLARGTVSIYEEVGATILTTVVDTYPTDPIDSRFHKRILVRVAHISSAPFTAGKLTIEFSDTEAFTEIKFFQTIDLDVATNPLVTLVAAAIGGDTTYHTADLDVESMGAFCRVKVRNDSAGTITYNISIKAKVS